MLAAVNGPLTLAPQAEYGRPLSFANVLMKTEYGIPGNKGPMLTFETFAEIVVVLEGSKSGENVILNKKERPFAAMPQLRLT